MFKYYEELQSLRTKILDTMAKGEFKYYEELQSLRTSKGSVKRLVGSNITKNYNP